MFSPSTEIPSSIRDGSWASPPATRLPPTRSEYQGKLERNYPPKYPRIVLKDSLGNKLDTFTYLQEAIYRAEWNVKNSHEAVLPEEWRLPKAPNPARPDYSRTAPVLANIRSRLKTRRDREQGVSRSQPQPRLNEIDVGDVAFVAESLNQLPKVPSLSFLHHDLLAEPKHYFQIVHQAMVQRRYYAQTDKRERVYNFPGFCTGCRKSGLCYGCERSSEPHYHVDRIMRTGGGFTYHRHDHPIQEHVQKNPSNWKLTFPELSLKHLMKEQESASESLAEEDEFAEKQEEIKIPNQSAQKASNDTGYPVSEEQGMEEESVGTQEEIVKHWAMMRETPLSAESDVRRGKGADKNQNQSRIKQENMDAISPWKDTKTESKDTIDESLFRGESHTSMGSQEITIPIDNMEDPNYNATDKDSGQQSDVPLQNQILENAVEQEDKSESSEKSEHHLIDPVDVQNQTDNDADSEGEEDEDDQKKKNSYNSSSKTREKSHSSGFTGMTGSQKTKTAGATPNSMGDSSSDHRGRREDRSEGSGSSPYSPYSNKRRQPLYKAPPAFKVKHRKNRATESRSPFSTDRKYDLPTGSGFHVKKSEKKLTEFKEFKHHEGEWKEPEKFTVKKAEKSTTNFWSAPKKKEPKKKERVKREQRPISPDSGLESEKPTDSVQELPLKSPAFIEAERVHSPPLQKISSPVDEGISPSLATPIVELPKKERPKKTKKEAPPKKPPSPIRSITPPSPAPVVEEVQVNTQSRDPTPEYVPTPTPKIPDLPPVNIPALPEIIEEKKEKKPKVDTRKAFEPIQVMPKIKDAAPPPPKKSRPPLIMKKSSPKKRVPSAEAPVTTEEIMQMKDPLDFLAKYCIISKDRLPFYERIYRNVVSSQPERYERQHPLSPTTGMPVTEGTSWGKHELGMFHDLILISRGQEPKRPGLSGPEQYLEKICYTLEMLDSKHQQLSGDLHLLETKRIKLLAERAKDLVPDITSVNFKKKEKKSKKKKKKKNKVEQEEPPAKVITSRADITDDVIVSRIDEKLLKKMMKEPAQHQLNCEIERCTEKLANIEDRLIQLEGEKNIIGMYCMELFFDGQNDNNKPPEFRRQQSFLYKTLHPDPDVEMNREELEGALQIVNHNLLTENEFSYMYHILNLTGRRKVNFKLFCVIAALSERITHMDPVIRELLNKEKGWKRDTNDYDTLDVRMNRSKELFQLLDEGDSVPFGNALASSLAVELTAGGLSPELTNYVMSKFNREGKGYVDFLDYVTYVPLFIEIHEKIIKDPLCSKVRIK